VSEKTGIFKKRLNLFFQRSPSVNEFTCFLFLSMFTIYLCLPSFKYFQVIICIYKYIDPIFTTLAETVSKITDKTILYVKTEGDLSEKRKSIPEINVFSCRKEVV
jgi:hypothetical protein